MKAILFPGQGAQYVGMGKKIFDEYPEYVEMASDVLGYSIKNLCLSDTENKLNETQYTQPALYVVNALEFFFRKRNDDFSADIYAGHSLGEYNALLAAGAFDFGTGLQLVKKRGELMSAVFGGGMAAIIGVHPHEIERILDDSKCKNIYLTNYNTPTQTVISGKKDNLDEAELIFKHHGIRFVRLKVSAPFHSKFMDPVREKYFGFLKKMKFSKIDTEVISNYTAEPYFQDEISELLALQLVGSVQWMNSVRFMMGRGVTEYIEIGSNMLSRMVDEIKESEEPILTPKKLISETHKTKELEKPLKNINEIKKEIRKNIFLEPYSKPLSLGSSSFCEDYDVNYTYVVGALNEGISSIDLVERLSKNGFLGFLDVGTFPYDEIEKNVQYMRESLGGKTSYGFSIKYHMDNNHEMEMIKKLIQNSVKNIEILDYIGITSALVLYRIKGLSETLDGKAICGNKIIARVSNLAMAEKFMRPAPKRIVQKLLHQGLITPDEALLAEKVPMSHDVFIGQGFSACQCGGSFSVVIPVISKLRKAIMENYDYDTCIRIGLEGSVGSPESVASVYIMGADFVISRHINQCTKEAATSNLAKDMLQVMNIEDVASVSMIGMSYFGKKIQVLKKGVFFPVKANKLHSIYKQYGSLEKLPQSICSELEEKYFKNDLYSVFEKEQAFFLRESSSKKIEKVKRDPKYSMELIFNRYFKDSFDAALKGDQSERLDFQIHTDPDLGVFNQWVLGTDLEDWKNRHAEEIGEKIMHDAAQIISNRYFA